MYLWSAETSKVVKLKDYGANDFVTSVSWSNDGTTLAVGTNKGYLQIWDTEKNKMLRQLEGHNSRIGALSWNSRFLTSGSKDKNILHRDLRINHNYETKLIGHRDEICGLKWSFDGQQLASGGNDNKLIIWSAQNSSAP